MIKAQDLRDQSIDDLEASLVDIKKELFELRNEQKRTRKLEKPHLLKEKKKDIAKLNTIIREKQMANV